MSRYRKAQKLIKQRRYTMQTANRWRKCNCSCGHHNMRGDK